MTDRSTYAVHADLLAQVASSAEEDAHVRRVLGANLSERELDARIADKWPACCGSCDQGRRPCHTPEACQCSARPAPRAGDLWCVVGLVLASWAAVAFVLLVLGFRL